MDGQRTDILSAVLVIVAMLLIVVPRVLISTNDPIPSLFGIDALVLSGTAVMLLAIGNIALHLRASG